jgi:hypothetical protein
MSLETTCSVGFTRTEDELELVSAFHALRRERHTAGALSPFERLWIGLIRELLEPRRVVGHRLRRDPVRLCVNRSVTLAARGHLVGGTAVALGLRHVELTTPEPLRVGDPVALSIAGLDRRRWYTFHGRVVRCRARSRRATIELLARPPAPRRPFRGRGRRARAGAGAAPRGPAGHIRTG